MNRCLRRRRVYEKSYADLSASVINLRCSCARCIVSLGLWLASSVLRECNRIKRNRFLDYEGCLVVQPLKRFSVI